MSLRTELPTMQNRAGATPTWRRIRSYVVEVLLQHDLDLLEVVGDPRRLDLARLVDEVALRDQHEPVVAGQVGERRRHVRAAAAPSR